MENTIDDTISLKTLWRIFSVLKRAPYKESVDLGIVGRPDFRAEPEMVFYSLQKELVAQSEIGMN